MDKLAQCLHVTGQCFFLCTSTVTAVLPLCQRQIHESDGDQGW